MNNIFCLQNLQENAMKPNYDNILVYSSVEESFTTETFRALVEMNNAYREESKILYRTMLESGDDFEVVNEGVSDFVSKVKDIISKFLKFLKSLFERFSIMIHKMVSSEKYIKKNKDKLLAFDSSDNFNINGYNFTIDGTVPVANALAEFTEDFIGINFDIANGKIKKDSIKDQYDKFINKVENGLYDEFRAQVIAQNGYISQEDFGKELFEVYRDGQSNTNVIEITPGKVTESMRRFDNYSEIEKVNRKLKDSIEKDYKEIEKQVARMVKGVRDKDAGKILTVSVDSDYATVQDFQATNDEMHQLDLLIKAKTNQIIEMSNIHSMAFSYKMDAIKDCYKQDKAILYKALSQIAKNHKYS